MDASDSRDVVIGKRHRALQMIGTFDASKGVKILSEIDVEILILSNFTPNIWISL